MHLHILGICGTFMGSLALLARDLGHTRSQVQTKTSIHRCRPNWKMQALP